jgi:hypothetical protein
LPEGEARLPTPGALVEDPADREMGMPGLALAGNPAALERGFDAGLNLAGRERAIRDAHPEDARSLEAGERAETVEAEGEGGGDRRRLDERGLDFADFRIGSLPEKPERQVKVGCGHPRDSPAQRPEALDLGAHGRPHRLIQE